MDLQELLDREELRDIHYTYCYSIDTCDEETFVDLFAEDGSLVVPSFDEDVEGHDDLRAFMRDRKEQNRPLSAHLPGTPSIVVDGDEASARWYVFVMVQYSEDELIWGMSLQEVEYARLDGEWKITTMTATRKHTLDMSSFL